MPILPASAADLSPSWLSEVLDADVVGVEVLEQALATNQRLRLALTYAQPGSGPASLFVKLPPLDPAHRAMIGADSMGEREACFYRDVAPLIDLRVPRACFAASTSNGDFVLLLEDLAAGGCMFSDGAWGVTADDAAGALEDLARFHAWFGDSALRASVAPWTAAARPDFTAVIAQLLHTVLDEQRSVLSPSYVATGQIYVEHHGRINELWEAGPQTYIHGDTHIGNVFLDGGRVGLHDWGLSRVSTPLRDVSYFLTMAVDPEHRRAAERELLGLYVDALRAAGGADIPFDDAWFAHRIQTAYTVLATFLVFMPSYATPEAQVLGADLLRRSQLALDDLDVVPALNQALA